jgi:hypothetical protein
MAAQLRGHWHSGELAMRPKLFKRGDEAIHVLGAVQGAGGDAQALGAFRNGRIVDRLDINPVPVHQNIREVFALGRIAHHHGDDVAGVRDMRDAGGIKAGAHLGHALFLGGALGA